MSTSLPFPKHGDIILKSTTKTRAKSDSHILSRPELYEWYEDIIVFRVFIFILLFRTYGKERNFRMREASVTVIIALLKELFWKLHNQCYVQSSFSTIVSQSDNSIDKGIQRLKILQVWINIWVNSFIKTWVSKHQEMKNYEGVWKSPFEQKIHACTSKNIAPI